MADMVDLYQGNAGQLYLIVDETSGYAGIEAVDPGLFAQDSQAILNNDTDDWIVELLTPEIVRQIIDGPETKWLATYTRSGGVSRNSDVTPGHSGERYLGSCGYRITYRVTLDELEAYCNVPDADIDASGDNLVSMIEDALVRAFPGVSVDCRVGDYLPCSRHVEIAWAGDDDDAANYGEPLEADVIAVAASVWERSDEWAVLTDADDEDESEGG